MKRATRILLIVDDSPEDRELYQRYLRRDQEYDYTILEAALGQHGLDLWQQQQPDAILLDYRLPDMDGLEFLAKLQPLAQQPCLPVIVVTGQGNEAIAVQAIKAGAQDYLIKEQTTWEGLCLSVNSAIATVQLHTQLHQRIERERLVAQISRKIHQTLNLDEILQTTVDEVRQFLQTDRVLLFRLQTEGWGTVITESVSVAWTPVLSTSHYDPCLKHDHLNFFHQGLVTVKPDIYDGSIDPCHVELLAALQVRANLVVPILQKGLLWGMLIAHHCTAPRQWQPLEIDLLKELATQVGVALQQADLYQQAQTELLERKRAEMKLRQAKGALELRVAKRTAELRQLNAELQQSESTLRSFFNSGAMPMGIVELHSDDILHLSDNWAAAQFFGTTPDALRHQYASALGWSPDTIQRWIAYYRQAEQTQTPVRFEYLHATSEAQYWLSGSVCLIAVNPSGYPRFSYLVEDVTDRKQAETHIAASLKEKEVLLKEIHHRVKNNLGVVSGLLEMQSRRTQDSEANTVLQASQNRIASIALVHEKLYGSEDLAKINFSQYIRDLTVYLFDSYNTNSNQVTLTTQVDADVSLDIETAIPCGLIINELVSNALKHAFPQQSRYRVPDESRGESSTPKGEVQIRLNQSNHPAQATCRRTLALTVCDNGVGLPDAFDLKSAKTLGLSLVKGLTMQLGGTLEINGQHGSEFKITFTKNEP